MTVKIPSFNLGKTQLTAEEFANATAASTGKGFAPGNYTLKITNAEYHVNAKSGEISCPGDATWINIAVTLTGADDREKKYFLQVPTQSPFFGAKQSTFNFKKLIEFMAALGVYLDAQNYTTVIPKYFGSPEALASLVGAEVNLDIGYNKTYLQFIEKGRFKIVLLERGQSKDYVENDKVVEFPDRDSAKVFAMTTLNKDLQTFPEILKFHPGKERKAETKASGDGW
jgi:hypothetical protein